MYTYSRVTSICIDLSKIKLFVFVFVRNVRNNLLDLAYSSLICRNISQSSLFKSLKVKPKYLDSVINFKASEPMKTVGRYSL